LSSEESIQNYDEMVNFTKFFEMARREFWLYNKPSFVAYRNLYKKRKKAHGKWMETIQDFRNSIPHHDGLVPFYIECDTDFIKAILTKHKAKLIEDGFNNAVDNCFIFFVRKFPRYFKEKIVDSKGNFLQRDFFKKKA
jgi:guanylate cyclase